MAQKSNTWHIGNVKITRIVEMELPGAPPNLILKDLTVDQVQAYPWLQPSYADAEGMLNLTIQAYVIESEGKRIIVDTCVGNDKKRDFAPWNNLQLPFLGHLAEAGFPPESIDTVLCTHLHVDHVGWNTMKVDGKWVPTFPKAKYLFARTEWEHWQAEAAAAASAASGPELDLPIDVVEVLADSVVPIIEAGLHSLVEATHRITGEVSLVPTPGHTPGHVSVLIRSNGAEAVITGDMMHHPIQIAIPDLCSNFCTDPDQARATRREFLKTHEADGAVIFGTHFCDPPAGRVVRDGDTWRFETAQVAH